LLKTCEELFQKKKYKKKYGEKWICLRKVEP